MTLPKPTRSKKGHPFDAEMRVSIDTNIYPESEQDEKLVFDLAQRALQGEQIEGVIVEKFIVRDESELDRIEEYDFAAQFMRSAKRDDAPTEPDEGEDDGEPAWTDDAYKASKKRRR